MQKDEEQGRPRDAKPFVSQSALKVANSKEPIRLKNLLIDGVSAEAAQENEPVQVWTRLALTSDDSFFHRVVENLTEVITTFASQAGAPVDLARAHTVLLVIRSDNTGELWVDGAAVVLNILTKRSIQSGAVVFDNDIADVIGVDFPRVEISAGDKVLYLFREDWRFALFFDFNPEKNFSRENMSRTLGTLYRRLKYRHLYDVVANQSIFERLVGAGWFPFVEIIGHEFKALALASEAGFPLGDTEAGILKNFDDARLERMAHRWFSKPSLKAKEAILRSAINAYKNNDPVAVLKIVLTEIEGILAEAHFASKGSREKLKQLLEFACSSAEKKSGAPDTLLFPIAFGRYLQCYTFAHFDPSAGTGSAGSRHAVGHGVASAESYTQIRALQSLLTLDQFVFYL